MHAGGRSVGDGGLVGGAGSSVLELGGLVGGKGREGSLGLTDSGVFLGAWLVAGLGFGGCGEM